MDILWQKELELGNPLIDTQHRMLILLCNKLDIAIQTHETQYAVQRVILELKKFTEFHFVSEENLMLEIGYPELEQHMLIHSELLRQLNDGLIQINRHNEQPAELLAFLKQWLVDHVVHEDLKIADHVKNGKRRPIGENLYAEYLLSK
jgi:hemerythrin-like metal-binding protein